MIDLSIIIVSYNTKKLTVDCIVSLQDHTKDIVYEVIVVDNASTDGSIEALEKFNLKVIRNEENIGFGKANNQGIKKAKGKYILFLNSDTLIESNVLGEMVKWMYNQPKVGIASCALKNKDGTMQGTGGYFPTLTRVFTWMTIQDLPFVDKLIKPFHPMKEKSFSKGNDFYGKERELDWVTGAFMLVKNEVVNPIKGFDEDYFMYTEEVDFCFRAKKLGWKVYYNPSWGIVHYGGASGTIRNSVLKEFEGVKLFYKKHYSKWKYPVLRILLKIGSLVRMVVFGLIEGKDSAHTYAQAFKSS